MAIRFQQFLLIPLLLLGSNISQAIENDGEVEIKPIVVVEPDRVQREVYEAQIDTEFFEVGAYIGLLSIEDFGSTTVTGLKGSFHATEDFFLQFNYGQATAGKTPYEELALDGDSLITDRDYKYYDLLVGYNVFPGETFVSQNHTYNSAFYLVAGAGNTNFADDNYFTVTIGSGYRIILRDWLTVSVDFRDHSFESEAIGSKKRTHNLEFSTGVTAFF